MVFDKTVHMMLRWALVILCLKFCIGVDKYVVMYDHQSDCYPGVLVADLVEPGDRLFVTWNGRKLKGSLDFNIYPNCQRSFKAYRYYPEPGHFSVCFTVEEIKLNSSCDEEIKFYASSALLAGIPNAVLNCYDNTLNVPWKWCSGTGDATLEIDTSSSDRTGSSVLRLVVSASKIATPAPPTTTYANYNEVEDGGGFSSGAYIGLIIGLTMVALIFGVCWRMYRHGTCKDGEQPSVGAGNPQLYQQWTPPATTVTSNTQPPSGEPTVTWDPARQQTVTYHPTAAGTVQSEQIPSAPNLPPSDQFNANTSPSPSAAPPSYNDLFPDKNS